MFNWASGYITNQMTAVIDTEVILPETDNDGERHKEHGLGFKVRWDGVNVGETAEVSVGVGVGGGGVKPDVGRPWERVTGETDKGRKTTEKDMK